MPDLHGRVFAVTGATGGIGYFAAEQLAGAGATIILASRSRGKLETAARTLRSYVPDAELELVTVDLTSLASTIDAGHALRELPRLDGIFLNGGPVRFTSRARTSDGLPLLTGAHAVANFALAATVIPRWSGLPQEGMPRIVHASTSFVDRFRVRLTDVGRVPWSGFTAYVKAKTITEIFAYELDRRARSAGSPLRSLVAKPGAAADAKTPRRAGVRDETTPYQRNPYTPWAQGKDTAAWPGVRALVDSSADGGEAFGPADGNRGLPVPIPVAAHTAAPDPDVARAVWAYLEETAGVTLRL